MASEREVREIIARFEWVGFSRIFSNSQAIGVSDFPQAVVLLPNAEKIRSGSSLPPARVGLSLRATWTELRRSVRSWNWQRHGGPEQALKALLCGGRFIQKLDRNVLLLLGCCVMAIAAVCIIARSTTQGEGRVAYTGLSAFAILAVFGGAEIFSSVERGRIGLMLWPVVLLALNVYAFLRFVIPFSAP